MANAMVLQNAPVETRLMDTEEAMRTGAMALFGEKYGEEVRVVSMGTAIVGEKAGKPYSIELCGGTHVSRTGDIGLIRILSESAVAAGVRRIEALTGEGARRHLAAQDERVRAASALMKARPEELVERIAGLMEERKKLERQLAEARRQLALGGATGGCTTHAGSDGGIRQLGDVKLLARSVTGIAPKDLRGLVDDGKKQVGSGIVAIIGVTEDGKAGVAIGVTDDLTKRFSAVDLVRLAAEALGGKGGGGRPDMAQAGGPDGSKAQAAIAAIEAGIQARAAA
jgi:alanyl-tRNA synthetase